MQIFITSIVGKTFTLGVNSSDKIEDIKTKIAKKEGMPNLRKKKTYTYIRWKTS